MLPEKIHAALLGGAVGDAIGLPFEGLSPRRAQKMAKLPLRHHFLFGHGMVSDDTDHSVFVVQAIWRSQGDVRRFRTILAWRLRGWLLTLPAGIGMATLKACCKLCIGWPNSAVYSAGNGPSMRSAVIGAMFADDATQRRAYVSASTHLTHSDPKALAGALAIAEIAARLCNGEWKKRPSVLSLCNVLLECSSEPAWLAAVTRVMGCLQSDDAMGMANLEFGGQAGVSGYTLNSVPFAIVVWYTHQGQYQQTIEAITQAGGDVDTVAAMAGALAGIQCGTAEIPVAWREKICDFPHNPRYLQRLAHGTA